MMERLLPLVNRKRPAVVEVEDNKVIDSLIFPLQKFKDFQMNSPFLSNQKVFIHTNQKTKSE